MEGDKEVMKRSDRDEAIWVVTHIHMETAQRISLYKYLYLKSAKMLFFLLSFFFSSIKSENKKVEQVLPRVGGGQK
jgi:hypothetical protein